MVKTICLWSNLVLHIKESLRAHKSDKGKGKEVAGPSVNMTENGGKNKQNKGKKWSNENNSGSSSNKKPKLECWKCSKTGHFKRDYRRGKKEQRKCRWFGKGVDAIAWWIASGATTHVCKVRCWLVPSCYVIFDLDHLSLSFDFVFCFEIFKPFLDTEFSWNGIPPPPYNLASQSRQHGESESDSYYLSD
ncbi:zinc finger, CCHC-type containing protein [Tanacetum coccineum]